MVGSLMQKIMFRIVAFRYSGGPVNIQVEHIPPALVKMNAGVVDRSR